MKERIRGYTDAVLEEAAERGATGALASELAAVRDLVAGSDDLRSVLADPGIAAHARRGLLRDLLGGQVSDDTLRLLDYAVEVDRAPELTDDTVWLAARVGAARDRRRLRGPTVLGHRAALERVDGYAAAVLGATRDAGRIGDVEDELFRFGRIVDGSAELSDTLTGPDGPPELRAGVVRSLLEGKASPATTRLAAYAATVGRPRDFPDLIEALVARVALETRRRIAEVRAAAPLTHEQERRLAAALGRMTGQSVEVRVVVDPSVLGGFVAAMGDTVVDGSVRHRLDLLKDRLAHAEVAQ